MTKEGDAAHFAERGRLYAIHAKEMDEAHNVHIKNSEGDTMSADDILNAEKPDALAALEARLAALEGACEVKNAEEPTGADLLADLAAQHAPAADVKNADKPETKLAVVTKDEDNGVNVKNAEAQTRAEAERIAALPESDRAAAIAAKIFGAVAR